MHFLLLVVCLELLHHAVGNMPPTIGCPDSDTLVIPKNQAQVSMTWDTRKLFAIDQEDGDLTPTLDANSPQIGQMVSAGPYTIAYSVKDSGGRISQCSFTITVSGANCPALPSPQHGTSTCRQGAIFGQVCSVICDTGYEVLKENAIECQQNGTYTGDLGTCERITSYQLICDNIATSPTSSFTVDIDTNLEIHKQKLMEKGSLDSFQTMPRARVFCNKTENKNHGSCIWLRRFDLFELLKTDGRYNDYMYRRVLLVHPEISKFCKKPDFLKVLFETFPDIERRTDVAYQSSFKNTMPLLVQSTTTNLRNEAASHCNPKDENSECLLADVFDVIDRSNTFLTEFNKVNRWDDIHIIRYFNALTFSSVLLKWTHLDAVSDVRPLTNRGQQNVLTNILSAISVYIDDGDDEKVRFVIGMFREYVTDKICNNGKMCLFWRVVDQTRTYIKSRQPSTSNGIKVRVLDSTLDKREFLQQKQMERMLQLMADQEYNLIAVAQDLKDEFKKTLNDRFSELKTYFKKIHSFSAAKAKADLIVITQIKDLSTEASALAKEIDEDTKYILVAMMTAAGLEVAGKAAKLALTIAQNCNPIKAISDLDLAGIYDAASEMAHAVANLASSAALVASLNILRRQSIFVSSAFAQNDAFFKHMKTLMDEVSSDTKKSKDFEDAKDAFLKAYNDFTPAIKRNQVTELGSYFTNVIDQACSLIEGTETLHAAIPKGIIGGTGLCWKTKVKIDKMMTMYESIYDKQFELVEVLATNVQAQVALEAADGIVTDYTKVAKEPSVSDDVLQRLQQVAGMSYVSYRLMLIQVIRLYCDELEYQNGGNKPTVCKEQSTDVSTLLSYRLPGCNRKLEFESVPARKRRHTDTAFLDVEKLYKGEEVTFKIPNNNWLYQGGWITKADMNSAIYVMGFEVYLPSEVLYERDIRVQVYVGSRNELTPGGTRYRIEPRKPMIFEYKLGQGINCRQGKQFDNPYNTCPTNKIADICPQTEYSCFLEVADRALYPSIYSDFVVKVNGYEGITPPNEIGRLYLRVGVRTCTYIPEVGSGNYGTNFADQGPVHKTPQCCSDGQYWNRRYNVCTNCTGTVALKGYYCERPPEN